MVYGEFYQDYGVRRSCPRCGRIHAQGIRETQQSRFAVMQLVGELNAWRLLPINEGQPQERRMLGVLITPQKTFAAHSGKLLGGATPYLTAARGRNYEICGPRTSKDQQIVDVGGRAIDQSLYAGTRAPQAGPPGVCAAPRLVQAAIDHYRALNQPIDLSEWAMSEVMFDRLAADMRWTHGLTAHSCDTCENLLPLLLCRAA